MFKGSDTGLYEETICGKNEREIEPVYRHRTGPYLFTFIGSQSLETSYSHSLYVMYGLHLLFCRGKVVGFWRLHQMVIQETRQNKQLLTADKDCVMAFFTSSFIVCLNKPSTKSLFSKRGVCYGSSSHYWFCFYSLIHHCKKPPMSAKWKFNLDSFNSYLLTFIHTENWFPPEISAPHIFLCLNNPPCKVRLREASAALPSDHCHNGKYPR